MVSAKRTTWSLWDPSRFSIPSGRITLKLCTSFVALVSRAVSSTTRKTGSTWWRQYRKENSTKCGKCCPFTTNTWRATQTVWSSGSTDYIKCNGVTATKRCKLDFLRSWETYSRTTLLELGMILKGLLKAEPTWKTIKIPGTEKT